jgi:hypothetical protein
MDARTEEFKSIAAQAASITLLIAPAELELLPFDSQPGLPHSDGYPDHGEGVNQGSARASGISSKADVSSMFDSPGEYPGPTEDSGFPLAIMSVLTPKSLVQNEMGHLLVCQDSRSHKYRHGHILQRAGQGVAFCNTS